MRLFQEYGTRAAPKKPSYGNNHDNEYGDYAPVHLPGQTQAQKQKQEMSQEDREGVALQHEAKFQEAVINENQENLDMIEGMMGDLTEI